MFLSVSQWEYLLPFTFPKTQIREKLSKVRENPLLAKNRYPFGRLTPTSCLGVNHNILNFPSLSVPMIAATRIVHKVLHSLPVSKTEQEVRGVISKGNLLPESCHQQKCPHWSTLPIFQFSSNVKCYIFNRTNTEGESP